MRTWMGLLALAVAWTAAPVTTASAQEVAVVTRDLNLRAGPGTGYRVLTTIPGGREVFVRGCGGSWCNVEYRRTRGYVSARYLGEPGYASGPSYGPGIVGPGILAAPAIIGGVTLFRDNDRGYYYRDGRRYRDGYRDGRRVERRIDRRDDRRDNRVERQVERRQELREQQLRERRRIERQVERPDNRVQRQLDRQTRRGFGPDANAGEGFGFNN